MGERTVKDYRGRGMPGQPGAWDLAAAQAWVDQHIRHRGERRPRAAAQELAKKRETDPLMAEPVSPALERYRKHRASLALLDLRARRGDLIPRAQVHELLGSLAALIRGAGEGLQRNFGPDAALLLEEALNEADAYIDRFIRDARADPQSPEG